ncbi:MAG: hypothetical protein GTO45_29220 [Candidatus Aminicenantes bacterium]|nr:hypothetical protein [Candidatus Aminicenantes bacterium]NIM82874.1 hypothetical protein [Candidatus Aminicenantes bacterium]NIN22250.1 hypothetical protein [Candidatus Aminicenantes bacterium]NIN46018.1 hypothetical protein [Candidatus Aminicenantes bacterium]NIN88854.1 hypothetical protein [Candidatus Aminicenantes bacterium]
MVKKAFGLLFVCVLVLASPVSGQWVVDLNIPLYGQEVWNWCGAASAQMIMNGYPDPNDCEYIQQSIIWDEIQINNKPGEPANWATDPQGLQLTLLSLNPPPSGTWSLMTDPVREELMFDVLYWMNSRHYGVPTLIYEAQHWVVIKAFQTDVEPVAGSNPVLQEITIRDPWPPNQGATTTVSGSVWYSNYWYGPVNAPGTWYGYYVAIIEPPPVPLGKVYAAVESRIGDVVITPQQAIDYADYWKKKLKLYKKDPAYALLKKSDKKVKPLDPILVREEINPNLEKGAVVPYYYIVPYALENEAEKKLTRICVLVNAFTGNFEEVTAYDEPLTYVDKNKAFEAVAYNLELTMEEMSTAQAEVVFTPCYFTCLRSKPFWRIEVNNEVRYLEIACPDQVVEMMQDPCIHEDPIDPPEPIYGK